MESSTPQTCRGQWFRDNLRPIRESECRFTSKATWDYNCVGFVVGDFLWWHPENRQGHYWPDGITRDGFAVTYIKALATVNFMPCRNVEFKQGFELAAMFHRGGLFKHISLLVEPGLWSSKAGEFEDFEHPLYGSAMGQYGKLLTYLVRPRPEDRGPIPAEYLI